jgi:hypothetical protein
VTPRPPADEQPDEDLLVFGAVLTIRLLVPLAIPCFPLPRCWRR